MDDKTKALPDVPDRRLAIAFNFTEVDLAANRSGFLSWGQRWGLGRHGQKWLPPMLRPLMRGQPSKVLTVCGRIQLTQAIEQVQRQTKLREDFRLILPEHGLMFRLTAAQHRALTDHIFYRIYYLEAPNHILSLERALDHGRDNA
jgi:hypothetical protein